MYGYLMHHFGQHMLLVFPTQGVAMFAKIFQNTESLNISPELSTTFNIHVLASTFSRGLTQCELIRVELTRTVSCSSYFDARSSSSSSNSNTILRAAGPLAAFRASIRRWSSRQVRDRKLAARGGRPLWISFLGVVFRLEIRANYKLICVFEVAANEGKIDVWIRADFWGRTWS